MRTRQDIDDDFNRALGVGDERHTREALSYMMEAILDIRDLLNDK